MGSSASDVARSSSSMSAGLIEVARTAEKLGVKLSSLSISDTKGFEKMTEEVRELQESFVDLYHTLIKGGERSKMLSGFRKDLKLLKSELTSTLTSSLSGAGVSSAEKSMGASIVSDLDTQLNSIYAKFVKSTRGATTSAEFEKSLVKMISSLDTAVSKYEKLSNSVIKLREQEQKITEQRRYQAIELEALKSKYPSMVSLAGVLIDKNSQWVAGIKGAIPLLTQIENTQNTINTYYDREVNRKKETMALLEQQKKDPALIAQGTKEIVDLERARNRELQQVAKNAEAVAKIMYGLESGILTKKQAVQRVRALNTEFRQGSKQVSIWGLKISEANKAMIRLGGSTVGIMRFFSRWRNRILVATFALAGLIRTVQRWINVSLEADKQTASMQVVAQNLGVSVNSVTRAAETLAKDGILSINSATKSIKNLLGMGADLPIIVQSLDALKDAAIANGKEFYSVGEMFETFTQGLKEGRSQITDNIGVMTNLSNLTKKYAKEIKGLGYANGILVAFMKEAQVFEGARIKLVKTLSGQVLVLKASLIEMQRSMGEALQPIFGKMVLFISDAIKKIKEFLATNKYLIRAYAEYLGTFITSTINLFIELGKSRVFKTLSKMIISVTIPIIEFIKWMGSSTSSLSKFTRGLIAVTLAFTALYKINKVYKKSLEEGLIRAVLDLGKSFTIAGNSAKTMGAQAVGAITKTKAALLGLKNAFKSFIPIAVISAAMALIAYLTKIVRLKREIKALDEKKTRIAGDIWTDTETQDTVIANLDKMSKLGKDSYDKLLTYYSNLEKIRNISKQREAGGILSQKEYAKMYPTEPVYELSKAYTEGIRVTKELNKENKNLKEIFKDEIGVFEDLGLAISGDGKKLYSQLSNGHKAFEITIEDFIELNKVQKEYETKIGPIPQIQEEMITKTQELNSKISDFKDELDSLSAYKLAGDILGTFKSFKKNTEDVKDLSKGLGELITTYNEKIDFRKELAPKLLALNMLPEQVEEIITKALSNAENGLITLKELHKTTLAAEDAAYKLMIGHISTYFEEFSNTIKAMQPNISEIVDTYNTELESLNEQLSELRGSGYSKALGVSLAKEELKANKEILKVKKDINVEVDKYTKELDAARGALKDIELSNEDRVLYEDKIYRLGRALVRAKMQESDIEKQINDVLKKRKELLVEQRYTDVVEQARTKLDALAGRTSEEPIISRFLFGSKEVRDSLIAKERASISTLLSGISDTISNVLAEEPPDWENKILKLNNLRDALLAIKPEFSLFAQEMINMAKTMAQEITNSFIQFGDAMRDINNDAYSSIVEIKRLKNMGLISDEEFAQREAQINEESSYNRKVATHEQTQTILEGIRDRLTAYALEWGIMAIVEQNPKYALGAAAAAAGAGVANKYAAYHAKRAAYWEGIGSAESQKYSDTSSSTSTTGKGSTAGSTIQGQPQYITISPSVAFYGDYLFLGDTVQEVGDKLGNVIVGTIEDAIQTGQITLSDFD